MDFNEAWSYLSGEGRPQGGRLGLEGLQVVLDRLGNPEKTAKMMHIAGTNGKGSTATYSAYILASAGYRVGQYSSPAVYRFGERMRILDGRSSSEWKTDPSHGEIPEYQIAKQLTKIRDVLDSMNLTDENYPRYYEIITILAFMYFAEMDCDYWVVETGLGGRLDATNVIPAPEVAVITAIGIDHIEQLGNTFTGIATEKAGILKNGTKSLILYDQHSAIVNPDDADDVREVFINRAAELDIDLHEMSISDIEVLDRNLDGQTFKLIDLQEIMHTRLLPDYEPQNAALSIKAVSALIPDLSIEAILEGVELCYWPARIEKISDNPVILIDGAHNAQGARALRSSLDKLFPEDTKEILVVASMRDKDQVAMFEEILKTNRVKHIIFTSVDDNERALDVEELEDRVLPVIEELLDEELRPMVYNVEHIEDAATLSLDLQSRTDNSIIVELGSFYIANNFKVAIEQQLHPVKVRVR